MYWSPKAGLPPVRSVMRPGEVRVVSWGRCQRRASRVPSTLLRVIGRLPTVTGIRPSRYLGSLDLRRANLRKADLVGAYLGRSNLARGEFQDANLRSANLQFATLVRAEFEGACLEGAILRGADLRGAELRRADLRGATASLETRWPDGFDWKAAGIIMESNN